MVNSYLADGDIAPQILFYNGPASCAYNAARHSFYGWGYTPTFQVDGVYQQIGWNQSTVEGYIDARLAVPSYVDVDVTVIGNASGGTAYYTITVEQDPSVSGEVKVWSAILESHDIATSGYGVYEGQELMWEPRAWPLGSSGTPISITGPYPQTINVEGTYTLNPASHTFDNLDVITYVQCSAGNRDVLNASFIDLPDTATGIEDPGTSSFDSAEIYAWPNPSSGVLTIGSVVPDGATGLVQVYDIMGRSVASFQAGSTELLEIQEPGVYFARLDASSGEALTTRFTVVE